MWLALKFLYGFQYIFEITKNQLITKTNPSCIGNLIIFLTGWFITNELI